MPLSALSPPPLPVARRAVACWLKLRGDAAGAAGLTHLIGEVHVPRRVDEVERVQLPVLCTAVLHARGVELDGDAPLALNVVAVHELFLRSSSSGGGVVGWTVTACPAEPLCEGALPWAWSAVGMEPVASWLATQTVRVHSISGAPTEPAFSPPCTPGVVVTHTVSCWVHD